MGLASNHPLLDATRLTIDELGEPAPDGYGSALNPRLQLLMANGGTIGVNDVTLVARGIGGQPDLMRTEASRFAEHSTTAAPVDTSFTALDN